MSRLRPGGLPWLLRHELRLALRGAGGGRGGRRLLLVLLVVAGLLGTLVGLPLGRAAALSPRAPTSAIALVFDFAALAVFLLLLSQALAGAVETLYVRGDLDLLLSSPIGGRKVLAAKGAGIAARPFAIYGALLLVVVGPAALGGRLGWLGAFGVLAALALLAAALAMGLALAMFALIGPRATRTAGQALAALLGGGLFLGSQLLRLGGGGRSLPAAVLAAAGRARIGPASPLAWPAEAAFGQPLPLLGLLLFAALAFAGTATVLGRRFERDAAVGAGLASTPGPRASGRRPRPFRRGGTAALVIKEWRLLLRDPAVLSQVGLRVIYLLPLSFALLQGRRLGGGAALAAGVGMLSVVAAQVSGSLAWLGVSAEDAPDLLASSPMAGRTLRRAKLLAALLPVGGLLAGPLLFLATLAPVAALAAGVGSALSCASAALVNLWFERPAARSGFRRRDGALLTSLAEIALGVGWGFACALASVASPYALAAAGLSLLLLLVFWRCRRPSALY